MAGVLAPTGASTAVLPGAGTRAQLPRPGLGSGDAGGGRAPQLQRAVEGMDGEVVSHFEIASCLGDRGL